MNRDIVEREIKSKNGGIMLLVLLAATIASIFVLIVGIALLAEEETVVGGVIFAVGMIGVLLFPILMAGLKIVHPNEARILTLFGNYYGTIKESGFYYVNPFCTSFAPQTGKGTAIEVAVNTATDMSSGKKTTESTVLLKKSVSTKLQTLDNGRQKVNDVLGNPIIIGAIVIWQVKDPTKAVFSVENYYEFLSIQTDSTIRNVSRLYPYDDFDESEDDSVQEKTLRSSSIEIAEVMKEELQNRVEEAGLEVKEVKITHLAYAEEIAAAMLQRQQASAIIAARQKIVDGAVGMVKMAIDKLGEDQIVLLDEERKAAMVSNLLVVLCGNKDAQPIVNSGSIY